MNVKVKSRLFKAKDNLVYNWRLFCDRTSLHGFQEMQTAKKWLTKSVWFLLITGSFLISGYQCYLEISQYVGNPIITQTSILGEDDQLIYPDLKICYKHWLKWLNFSKCNEMGLSKSHIFYAMSYISQIFYDDDEFDVSKIRAELYEILKNHNLTNSHFYTHVSYEYPPGFHSSLWKNYNGTKFVFKKEFNLDQPFSFCYVICEEKIRKYLKHSFVKGSSMTLVLLAYSYVPEYPNTVSQSELEYYLKNEFRLGIIESRYLNFIDLPPLITVDNVDVRNIIISRPNYEYYIQITGTLYNWKKRTTVRCSTNNVVESYCSLKCELRTRFQFYPNRCLNKITASLLFNDDLGEKTSLCQPNRIRFVNATKPYSDSNSTTPLRSFEQDAEAELDENIEAEFSAKYVQCLETNCLLPCQTFKYEYTLVTKALERRAEETNLNLSANIYVDYPKKNTIFVITEIDAQTWDSMIGNLGGILGLWLGASILSFFQIFHYLCQPAWKLFQP